MNVGNFGMEVQDVTSLFSTFEGATGFQDDESLELFARCEEYRERAESSPIDGIDLEMSKCVLLKSFAVRAYEEFLDLEEGHPTGARKMKLYHALMVYSELI